MSRTKAAAVPASKVVIGQVYAVRDEDGDGSLCRFQVDCVTTHRTGSTGSPHDYESEITGFFIKSVGGRRVPGKKLTIKPQRLLGQFEEYAELQKQKQAEDKASRERESIAKQEALDLWRLLYQVCGLPVPDDPSGFHQPFRLTGWGSATPDINAEGVKPLLAGLRKLVGDSDVAHSANLVEDHASS